MVNFTQAADGVVTLDSSDLDFAQTVDAALGIVHRIINHTVINHTAINRD